MSNQSPILHKPDDFYKLVGIIYNDPKNIKAKIQILGSQAVFIQSIREVYEDKTLLNRLPKTQSIFIGVLYYAEKQGNIGKYKGISLRALYHFRLLPFISMFFITIVMLSNLTAIKISRIWGIDFVTGSLFFPFTYLIATIVTDVYGYKYMRRLVWSTVFFNLFFLIFVFLTIYVPGAHCWTAQKVYINVLHSIPRKTFACIAADSFAFLVQAYILAKLKVITKGKKFFLPAYLGMFSAMIIDSFLFFGLSYGITFPTTMILNTIYINVFASACYILIGGFIIKPIIARIKLIEKIDYYDIHTNFNPFSLKLED